MKYITVLVLSALFSVTVTVSQDSDLQFESYTVADGLSQSHVTCILQDSSGFMWFGTGDGLNKYDGYTYTVYRHSELDSNSLSHSGVNALLQDRIGKIWIGTTGGLDIYNPTKESFLHVLPDCIVESIVEDSHGYKWIGTWNGLWKTAPDGQVIRNYKHELSNPNSLSSDLIRCMILDHAGTIWIGTNESGLNSLNIERESFSLLLHDVSDSNSISSNSIISLLEDKAGSIWVGTSLGLNQYDQRFRKWSRYISAGFGESNFYQNFILSLAEDSLDRLWVGTDEGIDLYDKTRAKVNHYSLEPSNSESKSSDEILAIKFSRDGTLWLGTKNGIRKYSPFGEKFESYHHIPLEHNSLIANKVWSVFVDKKNVLWVGTDNGLTRIDRKTNHYTHFKHDPSDPRSLGDNVVLSILEDRNEQLWIGTWRTLDRFDRKTQSFTHYRVNSKDQLDLGNGIMMMQEGKDGNIWIGAWNSIHRFDPRTEQFVDELHLRTLFHDLTFGVLYEDRGGDLWIGTVGRGLLRYDRVKKTVIEFMPRPNDPTTLSNNFVNAIHESSDGKLWIGTTEGLHLLNPHTRSFTRYSARLGLANSFICGILEDNQGCLWISTNRGISRFDPMTSTFRNYDATDGLQSNEFNGWSAHHNNSGELFFGGINGLTSFFPDSLKDNPHVPPIRLTAFKIYSQGQLPSRIVSDYTMINLIYPENTFSFEFTALDYTRPGKNQYAYRLEGFDRDWIFCANRRFATYTNLDPGSYILRVKGSNNDGVWNETGISIPLSILPPFWKTWWFRGAMIATFTFLLCAVFYFRLRSVKKQNIFLEKKVEERTQDLRNTNENLKSEIETRKRIEHDLMIYEHRLENMVRDKTAELSNTVENLEQEVTERKRVEQKLLEYQGQLRSLASELSITEERERQRIATHLHDYVGQALAMCKLKLDMLKEGRRAIHIDEIRELLLQALEHTRSLTVDLSPPVLRELSFADAIEWLTQQFQNQHGILINFENDENIKNTSSDVKTLLYHAVRELLTNIIKHAHAKRAEVILQKVDNKLVIKVKDDGVGFDPTTFHNGRDKNSFGLFNIKERLLNYGGTFEILPQPKGGTGVTLTIPLSPENNHEEN